MKKYKQLTLDERYQISAYKKSGWTNKAIAHELGVDKSTIGRELRRNLSQRGYRPKFADAKAKQRQRDKQKKRISVLTWAVVEDQLNQEWSPQQISERLKLEGKESVSHERIYQHLAQDKQAGGTLYRKLRCQKKKRSRYGKYSKRGVWQNLKRIDERPQVVAEKSRIGDWELDTIIGKNHQGAIVTIVDRHSKLLRMSKIEHKTADLTKDAIGQKLATLTVFTLTSDNGREFAGFAEIEKLLSAEFYFANPYHSWERGVNENTNGLIRQFFPKQTDFATITEQDIKQVEDKLNNRPRKTLGYRTPNEVYFKEQEQLRKVALNT
jgi:transposase, IS30 family